MANADEPRSGDPQGGITFWRFSSGFGGGGVLGRLDALSLEAWGDAAGLVITAYFRGRGPETVWANGSFLAPYQASTYTPRAAYFDLSPANDGHTWTIRRAVGWPTDAPPRLEITTSGGRTVTLGGGVVGGVVLEG